MKKGNISDKRVDPRVNNENTPVNPPGYADFRARGVTSKPCPVFDQRPVQEKNWERPIENNGFMFDTPTVCDTASTTTETQDGNTTLSTSGFNTSQKGGNARPIGGGGGKKKMK